MNSIDQGPELNGMYSGNIENSGVVPQISRPWWKKKLTWVIIFVIGIIGITGISLLVCYLKEGCEISDQMCIQGFGQTYGNQEICDEMDVI